MKQLVTFLLLMSCFVVSSAQTTRVKIGDLYYNLSGATASVTTSDVVPIDCREPVPSKYTNATYIIPSHIEYNGLEYEVVAIDDWAFSGFTNDLYACPTVKNAKGSTAKEIILPPTIKRIGESAFANCTQLIKMIIPASVESINSDYGESAPFYNTPLLRELVYLSEEAPSGWHATSKTYVPNPQKYGRPSSSITDASILPIISANETSFIYSGETSNIVLTNNLQSYDLSFEAPSLEKNVGSHSTIVQATISNGHYSYDTTISLKYVITPKEIIVSTSNASRVYGEPNPEFVINYEGFVNNENVDVFETVAIATTTATQTSNIGQYPIKISGAKATNYTFTYIAGELTVNPAPLLASIKSVSRQYGHSNPTFSLVFEGLKNGETSPSWIESPKFNTTATTSSPIGDYAISASATPKNYELSQISDGILTILPAKLKVIAENKSRLYYEDNPELTFYYSGFRNGETEDIIPNPPILTTSAALESDAGQYDIFISNISVPNYEIDYQPGVLTINPRKLSVQTGVYERAYGEENPHFELQYDGFVAGEDINDLTTQPSAHTYATSSSAVGSYTIYINGGEALNYTFNYISGTLKVVKANQNIIWNQNLTNLVKGQQVELLAYSTSGLPISYIVDNTDVCEIYEVGNTKYLDCVGVGEIQIRAAQDGDGNFYSTPRISRTVEIKASSENAPIITVSQLPIGSISWNVEWGSVHTFTIGVNSGWLVNSISINGEDYTDQMDKNGTFTTPPITHDTKIIISYHDEDSGLINIADPDNVKILGQENGIMIVNAPLNHYIQIYTIEGYLIKSIQATENEIFISLPNNSTYIVKINKFTGKIRL